jgi:cbb3-type cytochrome oxidase subunit 3
MKRTETTRVRSIKNLLLVVISLLGFFTAASPVFAAASTTPIANGFQISPLVTTLTIAKGQSQTVDIYLTNPTKTVSSAQAIVNNFVASANENGNPRLLLQNTPIPQNNFISLVNPIANQTILPGQQLVVPVTITVPSNANSGDYYGAIRFAPVSIGKTSTVGLTASVGTLFLITVPGHLVQKVELVQLAAAQNSKAASFLTYGGVQVMTRLDNVGQVHEEPYGKILIKNMFGGTAATIELNNTDPRANVLADSTRLFVNNVPSHIWVGHYTIEANLAYEQGTGNIIMGTASFWYLPFWFTIPVIIIIVAIIVLIFRRTSKRRNSSFKRQ